MSPPKTIKYANEKCVLGEASEIECDMYIASGPVIQKISFFSSGTFFLSTKLLFYTNVCKHICAFVCAFLRSHVNINVCVRMFRCLHVCMHECPYVHPYACMYLYMNKCLYVFVYARKYTCTHKSFLVLFGCTDESLFVSYARLPARWSVCWYLDVCMHAFMSVCLPIWLRSMYDSPCNLCIYVVMCACTVSFCVFTCIFMKVSGDALVCVTRIKKKKKLWRVYDLSAKNYTTFTKTKSRKKGKYRNTRSFIIYQNT